MPIYSSWTETDQPHIIAHVQQGHDGPVVKIEPRPASESEAGSWPLPESMGIDLALRWAQDRAAERSCPLLVRLENGTDWEPAWGQLE